LSFESRQVLLQGGNTSYANAAMCGRGGFTHGRGRGCGNIRGRSSNNNWGGYSNNSSSHGGYNKSNGGKRPICQVCEKEGHVAKNCWYCFDEYYQPERRTAATATHSYGVDTNWYTNTGATDHITGKLEKLEVRNKYNSTDQVHTANRSGMNISHIGHSVISTPSRDHVLKNILHVPEATKNLLSVHCFTTNNHASLEYFSKKFLAKDLDMRRPLLKGWCCHGMYPLPPKIIRRHAFGVVKPTIARWHYCLGHPSSSIVRNIISTNKLSCLDTSISESVCDACQKGKSH
jgi:hypothetical protein